MHAAASQHANVHAIVIRVAMIEHDDGASVWAQDSMNLPHSALGVGRVMQDAVGIDQIKSLVSKVELLGISGPETSRQTEQLKTFARELDGGFSQIDSRVV